MRAAVRTYATLLVTCLLVSASCGGGVQDATADAAGDASGGASLTDGAGTIATDTAQGTDAPRIGPTNIIYCGDVNCEASTHFCCLYDWAFCVVNGVMSGPESCPPDRSQMHCDDRTDCASGEVCCAVDTDLNGYAESTCASTCTGGKRSQLLCDVQVQDACPPDHPTCAADASSIFQGKAYCH
jgi:hypothetical protein